MKIMALHRDAAADDDFAMPAAAHLLPGTPMTMIAATRAASHGDAFRVSIAYDTHDARFRRPMNNTHAPPDAGR